VREPDGLAMSSRNAYLSPVDRMRALAISRGLAKSRERYAAGLRNAEALVGAALDIIQPSVDRIDYLEIRDAETLATVGNIDRPAVILAAVYVGTTRLIDNARLG
jgi:pantoate--beta-alanine ligase